MSWVLFVWIGYAGSHSIVIEHGPFKLESDCKIIGEKMVNDLAKERAKGTFSCVPKEKNT
jgi:hypothetical protein